MSEAKLGQILDNTAERDAIHVAIAPVIASQPLGPGEHVGLNERGEACYGDNPIGIVDPFLTTVVQMGERFYLCLYPNTVTGMRHHWRHPSFADNEGERVQASKDWIAKEAAIAGIDYDEIMSAAEQYLKYDDYLCDGGRWDGHYLNQDFWTHYEIVTGVKVREEDRGSFFSCSC